MATKVRTTKTRAATSDSLVRLLEEISNKDISIAGGKGASLGEMTQIGVPVPPGFIVTADAYKSFMRQNRLYERVISLLDIVDINNSTTLQETAGHIQSIIRSAPMPRGFKPAIQNAYTRLGEGRVAVRSSATAEDLPSASFAGQQRTYLSVAGAESVIAAVRACWASLFEARAIFYRGSGGFGHKDVDIAVVVQRMVQADAAGVMFTVHPSSADRHVVFIEALLGLGEPLVSGELNPDAYEVDKDSHEVVSRVVVPQPWLLRQGDSIGGYETGTVKVAVPKRIQERQKLSDPQIRKLAELGLRLEQHYGTPQDIEWALAAGELFILQSRPITTSQKPTTAQTEAAGKLAAILTGAAASPGIGVGRVQVVHSPREISHVMDGDVLVAEMTTPDYVPAMKRASAIVTDRGGRTCHAAIVSREMGIPCVVGTGNATRVLSKVAVVTVNGSTGKVYEGDQLSVMQPAKVQAGPSARIRTRTKLYVNLASPDAAERVASMDVDGIGLLRAEFILAHIGEHPRAMVERTGKGDEFIQGLAEGLEVFASAFDPRPVVYRFSDFKTNEYRNLRGGEAYESFEENPMLGYRGCSRYLAEPDLFLLEVAAVKQVRLRYPNLWVMLPFVRTVQELQGVKNMLEAAGLRSSNDFKIWMMMEVPSNVFLLDEFLDAGVDGVSIGSNDLTQLILGVDRDNEKLVNVFDERDPAVMRALERIVTGCSSRGVTVSICGQAPSVYPELTRQLVAWGITSVSVAPDMIEETRRIIQDAEVHAAAVLSKA
ncbi:MAG: phosphoenolpyruvate synthase [Dehalococcoidia bacterium]|nr:phosphoenolpyruvate synthase [Dehalococcoidia bacterium]